MKRPSLPRLSRVLCLLVGLAAPAWAAAQVYKWVDKDGKVHYSQRKEDAPESAKPLDIKTPPPAAQPASEAANGRKPWDPVWPKPSKPFEPAVPAPLRPKPLSNGREDGSDQSRCNLARDVLSGAVRHGNGKATDAYDREVAQNDVRNFCH